MRRHDFIGTTKAIAATTVQTLVWTSSEAPSNRVIAYHFVLTGGNDLGDIDRIRILANGSNIVDISAANLRAFWQTYQPLVELPTTATAFTVPLFMPDGVTMDLQDQCQFPANSQVEINVTTLNTTVAGAAYLGWTETSIAPVWYPRILSQTMNIPASTQQQRFNFQENGKVRGFAIPHTGVQRARFVLGNRDVIHVPGPDYLGVATGDMLGLLGTLYGNDGALTSPRFTRITVESPAPLDGSYIELQTGAGWAGVANEMALYAIAPNAAA